MNFNNPVTKAQPSPSSVHVDRTLTNMSVAVMSEEGFIADSVFPTIPVNKQSDLYRTYDRGSFQRDEMSKRAPGAESSTIGYSTSTTPYYADVYSLAVDIDEQTEENADEEVDLDLEATMLLAQAARINRDRNWASTFFGASIWTGEETLSGTSQFSDYAQSTPLEKIEEKRVSMMELTGFAPNTMVMGPRVWQQLKNHPDLVDRLNRGQTSGPAKVLQQNLAELLEVDRVLVPSAIFNNGVEGATDDFDFLYGKNLLMMYVPERPGRYTPSAGYTFTWQGFSGASAAGTRVKRFDMAQTSSRRIEIESAYDQKVIAPELGSIILDAVA